MRRLKIGGYFWTVNLEEETLRLQIGAFFYGSVQNFRKKEMCVKPTDMSPLRQLGELVRNSHGHVLPHMHDIPIIKPTNLQRRIHVMDFRDSPGVRIAI